MSAMFGNIISALQGGFDDVDDSNKPEDEQEPSGASAEPGSNEQEGERTIDIWSMAAAVAETVKQKTSELAHTLQETDWKAELEEFKKVLQEDTQSAAAAIEDAVEHLPENAAAAVPTIEAKTRDIQHQLGQVGATFGQLSRSLVVGTAEIFNQVAETIQTELASDDLLSGKKKKSLSRPRFAKGASARYSRREAEISAMQRDSSTYCDEPEDQEEYQEWLKTFELTAKKADIDSIVKENAFMAELQSRIVPLIVEYEVFWTRYFYRLHKLNQKHEQRLQLAQRAAQMQEEEVGWEDDDAEEQAGSDSANAIVAESSGIGSHHPETSSVAGVAETAKVEDVVEGPETAPGYRVDKQVTEATQPEPVPSQPVASEPVPAAPSSATSSDPPMETVSLEDPVKPEPALKKVATSGTGDADEPDAATASDSSGNEPWCVVTSPSKQQASRQDSESSSFIDIKPEDAKLDGSAVAPEAAPEGTAKAPDSPAKPAERSEGTETGGTKLPTIPSASFNDDELDLDDLEGEADGGDEAVDEDWGDDWE